MPRKVRGLCIPGFVVFAAMVGLACTQAVARVRWANILNQGRDWYGSAEARAVADNVLLYQRPSGGWPKDQDMTVAPSVPLPSVPDSTIDNGATTTQIRFLAVLPPGSDRGQTGVRPGSDRGQTPRRYQAAALRGIDYLLDAQYANGGWPQFYPLRPDYSRHITFNDNAMINAASLLEDVAGGRSPFAFVDAARRTRAADAVRLATDVILKSQIRVNRTLTAWCAQHDEVSLEPRPARTYEHVSLSGMESVGIVRFLMRQPRTTATERAVDAAVAWLRAARLPDGRWARFYELGTNRPIFSGRDGVIRYQLAEIEAERRDGYAWLGTWGKALVDKDYETWKQNR